MSRSTFNGPVLAGVDDSLAWNGTSTTTGPNWGFINMSQSYVITGSAGQLATGIVIPMLSTVTRISALVTTAWTVSSGDKFIHVGLAWGPYPGAHNQVIPITSYDTNDLVKDWDMGTVGNTVAGPGDTDDLETDDIDNWMTVGRREGGIGTYGPYDRFVIWDTTGATTGGSAVLTVNYCQAVDLSAIA